MEEALPHLPAALRYLRTARGLSQVEVATSAGITKAMLSAYERGRQYPHLPTLAKVLGVMKCSLGDLHEALELAQGRGVLLIAPPAALPPWALPLVHELARQIVNACALALEDP